MNHEQRTQRLLEILMAEHVDWFLVHDLFNVRYLSGFTGSHAVLLISPEKRYLLTDGRYQEQVKHEVKHYEPIIQINEQEIVLIQEALGDLAQRTVWFEADHCTHSQVEEMKKNLAAREWMGKQYLVERLRQNKDADEIAVMREALQMAEAAWERVLGEIHEGMTERELGHRLEDEMWGGGAEKESFETLIQFGGRSSLPHGKPTDSPLRKGDVILMDFGCVHHGYCSDITRTVFFGDPGEPFPTLYRLVREANEAAAAQIHAGITTREADRLAREVIEQGGYGEQFMHGLGHGVGLQIHEAPRLSFRSDETLSAGNVVTIEPGIYLEGQGGIRIEDMAVITEDGCEVLNGTGRDLIRL